MTLIIKIHNLLVLLETSEQIFYIFNFIRIILSQLKRLRITSLHI